MQHADLILGDMGSESGRGVGEGKLGAEEVYFFLSSVFVVFTNAHLSARLIWI